MSDPSRLRSGLRSVAVAFLLAGTAGVAGAQSPGISLAWQDCRGPAGTGFNNQNFGCATNIITMPVFPSFVLETAVDSVFSMELVIDVIVDQDPLPAWWHMEPGGCRASGWSADASLAGSCTDAWAGAGSAAFQGWFPGQPGGSAQHARLLVAASVLSGSDVALEALTPYTACRVLLRSNETLSCAGCEARACLVFNSLLLRRLPGSSVEEVLLSVAQSAGSNMIAWQGAGADCQAVPVRRATWGAVKALYR